VIIVGQQVLQHPGGEGGGAPAALPGDRDPSIVASLEPVAWLSRRGKQLQPVQNALVDA
jgi:hypothetical protein